MVSEKDKYRLQALGIVISIGAEIAFFYSVSYTNFSALNPQYTFYGYEYPYRSSALPLAFLGIAVLVIGLVAPKSTPTPIYVPSEPTVTKPPQDLPPQNLPPQKLSPNNYCPKCGMPVRSDQLLCDNCVLALAHVAPILAPQDLAPSLYCRRCGKPVRTDQQFCDNCGEKL